MLQHDILNSVAGNWTDARCPMPDARCPMPDAATLVSVKIAESTTCLYRSQAITLVTLHTLTS